MRLRRGRSAVLLILAGILTGAEVLVNAGIDLPYSDVVPVWVRSLFIFAITGGAFVVRVLAQREVDDRG